MPRHRENFRRAPLLATAVLLCATAVSQTITWGGLRFGMTENEAKSLLKERATRPTPEETAADRPSPGTTRVNYTAWIVRGISLHQYHGTASLAFGFKTKKLEAVYLMLDPPEEAVAGVVGWTAIKDELSAKYNQPVASHCGSDTCEFTWQTSSAGIVKMDILGTETPVFLSIVYESKSSIKDL